MGLDGTSYEIIIYDEQGEQKISWWSDGGKDYKAFLKVVNELLRMSNVKLNSEFKASFGNE